MLKSSEQIKGFNGSPSPATDGDNELQEGIRVGLPWVPCLSSYDAGRQLPAGVLEVHVSLGLGSYKVLIKSLGRGPRNI